MEKRKGGKGVGHKDGERKREKKVEEREKDNPFRMEFRDMRRKLIVNIIPDPKDIKRDKRPPLPRFIVTKSEMKNLWTSFSIRKIPTSVMKVIRTHITIVIGWKSGTTLTTKRRFRS